MQLTQDMVNDCAHTGDWKHVSPVRPNVCVCKLANGWIQMEHILIFGIN